MVKTNTLILVVVAILLGGGVFFLERQRAQQPKTEETSAKPIFKFSEDEVQQMQITTPSQTLAFKKATSGPSAWALEKPEAGPADEAAVLFLVNLLATAQSERTLDVSPEEQQDFGLAPPAATVTVTLKNQKKHTLILGTKDYREKSVYAQADPSPGAAAAVELVSPSFLDAIARPLKEWKYSVPAPTPAPTESSSPTPTESP